MSQSNGPRTVGDILAVSNRLARPGYVDWWSWREVVGERVATRSRPRSLERGTLIVTVQSALWAQELSLLTPLVIEALRKRHLAVSRVRFVVGEVEVPSRGEPVSPARPTELPPALLSRLERIDDEELRSAIASAASLSLGSQ